MKSRTIKALRVGVRVQARGHGMVVNHACQMHQFYEILPFRADHIRYDKTWRRNVSCGLDRALPVIFVS